MKEQRHELIREIVQSCAVETQGMLRELLAQNGINVTQATLSRDIRELGLIKGQDKYLLPQKSSAEIPPLLCDSVIDIDHAVNTVVFRCHAGMAGAACATFDRLGFDKVVGTIAGDDTIFILMRSEKDAELFAREMQSVIFSKKGDLDAE